MDPLKGAEMLSDRLGASAAEESARSTAVVRVSPQALPLFHWLGVEPADSSVAGPAPSEESASAAGGRHRTPPLALEAPTAHRVPQSAKNDQKYDNDEPACVQRRAPF